ncbi:unnamed protein product, partial [Darwinula stevensoni]
QEPGATLEEITNGMKHVRPGKGFEPNFPLYKKIETNGKGQHPLYEYLKSACPSTSSKFYRTSRLFYEPLDGRDIRWNFEKFLVDGNGKPFKRIHPNQLPSTMEKDVALLVQRLRENATTATNAATTAATTEEAPTANATAIPRILPFPFFPISGFT